MPEKIDLGNGSDFTESGKGEVVNTVGNTKTIVDEVMQRGKEPIDIKSVEYQGMNIDIYTGDINKLEELLGDSVTRESGFLDHSNCTLVSFSYNGNYYYFQVGRSNIGGNFSLISNGEEYVIKNEKHPKLYKATAFMKDRWNNFY